VGLDYADVTRDCDDAIPSMALADRTDLAEASPQEAFKGVKNTGALGRAAGGGRVRDQERPFMDGALARARRIGHAHVKTQALESRAAFG